MMERKASKRLSFTRRAYLLRTLGLAIGLLCVWAGLYPLAMPVWIRPLMVFNGLIWPHLAYQLSRRSPEPFHAEYRNVQLDSLMGGFWAATLQFNPLSTVTILSMMSMHNVAIGGHRLFIRGAIAQLAGILVSIAVFGPALQLTATPLQVYACLPMLTLYPFALGLTCYQLAIKLSEHKRSLSALSRTDSLTGLLNHGSWKDLLQLKFQKCREEKGQAVIAIIDIDHFKAINDSYGHIVGDSVLRQLSIELKKNLREDDLAGRYGGDEFCVILPNLTLDQANEVMERLRQVFGTFRDAERPQLRVSLSIGMATCHPALKDPTDWLQEADKALYVAKNTGRNKVSFANDCANPDLHAVAD